MNLVEHMDNLKSVLKDLRKKVKRFENTSENAGHVYYLDDWLQNPDEAEFNIDNKYVSLKKLENGKWRYYNFGP